MEREAFLTKLRARLDLGAPEDGAHPLPAPPAAVPEVRYRPDGRPAEQPFAEALERLGARLVSPAGLEEALRELEVRTAVSACDLALPDFVERLPLERAAEADAGVTRAHAACARTGTVVVAASPQEPRSASLVPRVHVCAVPRERLHATPGDVFRHLGEHFPEGLPSAFTLVTGPSRTSDIEMIPVRGVHGPVELVAVLEG